MTNNILFIDHRELLGALGLVEKLTNICPIPVKIVTLITGDFICGPSIEEADIAIERKTVDDFCASVYSNKGPRQGRLWTQSERLVRDFDKKYILVTGNLCDKTSKIHQHSLLGALARMLVEDIQVVFGLQNEDDFVYLLLKICEKHGKFGKVKI